MVQKGKRKMQVFGFQALAFCWVPRAGIEPARIAPLVFETSASTDSAIWAWCLGRFEAPLTETEVVDLLVLSLQRYCNLAKYQILFSDACLAS